MTMGELQNPQRNIPRSIIGGVFIVAVMYIGANLSYLLVLPAAEVKGISEELAAVFASRLFGDFFSRKIMSLLVLLSAYGCGFAVTFGSSRMIVAAAEQEFLPKSEFFARIHPSFKTPFNALVLYVCLALVLLLAPPSDTYFFLIDVIGYPTWIFFIITMSGLLILRFKKHGHTIGEEGGTGSFRVWLICPIVVICAGLFLSVLPFFKGGTTTLAAAAGLATLLLGFPVYYFQVYRRDHHRMNNNRTTVLISTNTPPTKSKELKR